MRILKRIQFSAQSVRACCFLLFFTLFVSLPSQAQWLDWQDITSTNLVLSTVANSDDEEKDISSGDLNNDGFADVIVVRKEPFSASTEPPKSDLLLINENGVLVDRTNEFAPEFLSNPSFARDVLIHDLDDDGWLDVVVANTFNQQPIYYRNQGNDGNGDWLGLVDESATRFPTMSDGATLICAVWAGDVNGDGFDDVYFVNYAQSGTAKDYLFMNDGNGVFTDESQSRLGDLRNSAFGTAVEIFDMDNDGDNDIIKTSVLFQTAPWNTQGLFLLYNDGTGNFNNWQKISPTNASYMFRVEDINLDGKLDVYVVDDAIDYQLIAGTITPNSNINYTSTNINSTRITAFGGNVHSADLDIDGDMEFAIADVDVDIPPCNSARTFAVMQNDNGNIIDPYTNAGQPWEGNSYDFCFLDVNNDGLQDMFIGRCEGYILLLNDNCELATGGADFDLDGITDACDECPTNPDPNCIEDPEFPTVDPSLNIARKWNEMLLASIRKDFARPTVHARNLFHSSIAMWDSWASYNTPACHYLLGNTVDGFECDFSDFTSTLPPEESTEATLSFAMYRLLSFRFQSSPEGALLQEGYDNLMSELGFDINVISQDYSDGDPIKLGNYIANCIINYGLQDGSNEQNEYANTAYAPINDPLVIDNPGNPNISDYNRWQPLTLDLFIDQSGNIIPGSTPDFLSPEWGEVSSFALSDNDLNIYQRDGYDYNVYHDPGAPPNTDLGGGAETDEYLYGVAMVGIWSSHLDPTDNVMWDISPGALGNSAALPTDFADYPNFYDQMNGGTAANGHSINPSTGLAYAPNMVPRGDFARVLAEFWADGPDSETPPGHWFSILNYVADHPAFEKKFEGQGDILPETEWYVKSYFGMGGAMHDAAVSAWGIKGWYDYIRPISALRAAADLGQSTDSQASNYHPAGIPLIADQYETIDAGDPLAGGANEHVNKIKMKAWLGHDAINNVDTDEAGVGWIRVEDWVPYQRPSFVTPPFAGYVSGHSTFSRAAAEYLTKITGDAYFPGGMGTFTATQDEFLVFEDGPSINVELQWATYHDAADQSGLSRIWGGIHPPADDVPGRIIGEQIGLDAFDKLKSYFMDNDDDGVCDPNDICADFDDALIGTPCDDGDACTTGETYDTNCQCSGGTPVGDSDGDGVCDAEDICQGGDDNLDTDNDGTPDFCDDCDDNTVGNSCDDGDACTINDVIDANCNCGGTFQDSDSDGVCDADDICQGGDDNIDSDNDGIPNFCDDCDNNTTGNSCDDGDACTTNDVIDTNCNCVGTFQDSDGDGVCDADDICPGSDDNQDSDNDGIPNGCDDCDDNTVGNSCDDGDACTTNDVIDANCNCAGTFQDSDNDGVCDADDICQGGDDNIDSDNDGIPNFCDDCDNNTTGSSCDDGDACTTNDVIDANCNCVGTFQDSDGDGVCDADDICPGSDDNQDSDNDGIPNGCDDCDANTVGDSCDDGDACTANDVIDANCNCAGTFQDSDNDGVCDADDICQGGDDSIDSDNDGIPDFCDDCDNNTTGSSCDDGDACTTNDVIDTNCNCVGTFQDSDGDGVCDADDICPGSDDNQDSDNDGIPNGCDDCDANTVGDSCDDGDACTANDVIDANCNCAGTFQDSDNDGVCDADDICQGGDDSIDSDNDGIPDFCDDCDNNTTGGSCDDGDACTINDVIDANCNCIGTFQDSDGDGVCDADDICPGSDDNQDSDNDGIPNGCDDCDENTVGNSCDDGDACTTNDVIDANCNCSGTFQDTDNDGVCDADDICQGGDDNIDSDNDGIPDFCDDCDNNTIGNTCDDGDACTINDVIDANCNCVGTFQDSDNDGVCDADDICQGGDDNIDSDNDGTPDFCDDCDNNTEGNTCDDGDACTTNDFIDANCNCAGTFQDTDSDGVCDADDICQGGDDNIDSDNDGIPDFCDDCDNNTIGNSCDDGDACTINDVIDANCNCVGTLQDSDNDGVCDADDICQGGDDNIDSDNDGTPDFCDDCDNNTAGNSCDDGDACTTNDVIDSNCNCVGTFQDTDNDGVCDADDVCQGGDDNIDSDNDGTPDFCDDCDNNTIGSSCDDGNACTINDVIDANCNCVGTFQDSDGDGVCDADDICQGGDDNIDSDNDGTPDFCDDCDNNTEGNSCDDGDACTTNDVIDANCNCAGTFQDSDGDGICDADDMCPNFDDNLIGTACDDGDDCTEGETYDANCGCSGGIDLEDSDGDGICDLIDECPNDPNNECNVSYCPITGNSTQYEYIDQVILESINNLSGDNSGYGDFTSTFTDIQKGHSYPISLVPGFVGAPYQEFWRIWIDLNGDGDFDDPEENVFEVNSNATINGTINIPNSGIEGGTRMRITMKYNAYATSCESNYEGEVEDYTVYLLPACEVGMFCDDGDDCTIGETYNEDCECTDGIDVDECEGCPVINFSDAGVLSYDPGQDLGTFEIQESGATLFMEGNSWKAVDIGYNVTPNTIISFEFKSTVEGEIHEVGFDNDLIVAPDHRIVVYGDQGYSGSFVNPVYSGSGDWESFTISLGDNFTGFYQYLVLTADDDATAEGNSYYRNVTLFEDLDGNLECDNSSDCSLLLTDNFESGYGNWNDGGGDCFLYSGNSNSGINSVRIRDNSGSQSSVFTDPLDLSSYASIQVSFTYLPLSMEANEDFFLEYSTNGGASYSLAEEWNSGVEFVNGTRYYEDVLIDGVTFTSNTIIRFRCDASGNGDQIYLDDITISGCESVNFDNENETAQLRDSQLHNEHISPMSIILYPNPASYRVNLDIQNSPKDQGRIEIRNTMNQLVYKKDIMMEKGSKKLSISIEDLKSGAYFITCLSGEKILTKRFIITH